jgi:hypothetical protein
MSDRDLKVVAGEAAYLLENPTLMAAFQEIENAIIAQMKYARIIDNPQANEYRDKLILTLQAVGLVQDKLAEYITTGQLSEPEKPEEY